MAVYTDASHLPQVDGNTVGTVGQFHVHLVCSPKLRTQQLLNNLKTAYYFFFQYRILNSYFSLSSRSSVKELTLKYLISEFKKKNINTPIKMRRVNRHEKAAYEWQIST